MTGAKHREGVTQGDGALSTYLDKERDTAWYRIYIQWNPSVVCTCTHPMGGHLCSSGLTPSPPFMHTRALQISSLVGERDSGLRLSLANMGMCQSSYWASWMAFDVLLTFATALLLVLFGKAEGGGGGDEEREGGGGGGGRVGGGGGARDAF